MDTKQELIDEKEQLDARIRHIDGQTKSDKFVLLPGEDQSRITLQHDFMQKYSDVLGERIREYDAERMAKDEAKGEGNPA